MIALLVVDCMMSRFRFTTYAMDSLQKWHAHIVDLKTLFGHWEARRAARIKLNKRDREILAICLFTLCLENNEKKRFLVGFPQEGSDPKPALLNQLFESGFPDLEDWDALLVPDLGPDNLGDREFHQCQLVGYINRQGGTEDIIAFLEEKKLWRPLNDDLRLILHLEQPTEFDWVKLSIHLHMRRPKCPFSQVFVISEVRRDADRGWRCCQLYPLGLPLQELDLAAARLLINDRPLLTIPSKKV